MRRELIQLGVMVLSAAGGVAIVALVVGGVVGQTLAYGALIAAGAGLLALVFSVVIRGG